MVMKKKEYTVKDGERQKRLEKARQDLVVVTTNHVATARLPNNYEQAGGKRPS
jgi:hypothetical protein